VIKKRLIEVGQAYDWFGSAIAAVFASAIKGQGARDIDGASGWGFSFEKPRGRDASLFQIVGHASISIGAGVRALGPRFAINDKTEGQ